MMDMAQKSQVCYRCRNFSAYYTKGCTRFERAKHGFCSEYAKIVENNDACRFWRSNDRAKISSKESANKVLAALLDQLSGIRQILQEANEDNSDET